MLSIGNTLQYTLGSPEIAGRTLASQASPDGFLTAIWTEKQLHITREGVSLGHVDVSAVIPSVPSALSTCACILWKPFPVRPSSASSPQQSYRIALVHERAATILDIGEAAVAPKEGSGGFLRWLVGEDDSEDERTDGHPFALPQETGSSDVPSAYTCPIAIRAIISVAEGNPRFTCGVASYHYILLGRDDCALAAVTWFGDFVYEAQLRGADATPSPSSKAAPYIQCLSVPVGSPSTEVVIVTLTTGAVLSLNMQPAAALLALPPDAPKKRLTPAELQNFAPFVVQSTVAHLPVAKHDGLVLSTDIVHVSVNSSQFSVLLACGRSDGLVEVFLGLVDVGASVASAPLRWHRIGSVQASDTRLQPHCKVTCVAWRPSLTHTNVPASCVQQSAVFACLTGAEHLHVFEVHVDPVAILPSDGSKSTCGIVRVAGVGLYQSNASISQDHSLLPLQGGTTNEELEVVVSASWTRRDISWGLGGLVATGPTRHLNAVQEIVDVRMGASESEDESEHIRVRIPHVWQVCFALSLSASSGSMHSSGDNADQASSACFISNGGLALLQRPPLSATADQPNVDQLQWRHTEVTPHYFPSNAPIRFGSSCPDSTAVAVCGSNGAAVYFPKKNSWRVFSTLSQEKSVRAVGLTWLNSKTLVLLNEVRVDAPGSADAEPRVEVMLEAYPRSHLDVTMRLCSTNAHLPPHSNLTVSTGLSMVTVGKLEGPHSALPKSESAGVTWIVASFTQSDGSQAAHFYRALYKAATSAKAVGPPPPVITSEVRVEWKDTIHRDGQGVVRSADVLDACEGLFVNNSIHQVSLLRRGADGSVVAGTESVSLKHLSGVDIQLAARVTLPRDLGAIASIGVLNTRVHLVPSELEIAGSKKPEAAGGALWSCLLPRLLVHTASGRVCMLDAHDASLSVVKEHVTAVGSVPLTQWGDQRHASIGALVCGDRTYTLVPHTRCISPLPTPVSAAYNASLIAGNLLVQEAGSTALGLSRPFYGSWLTASARCKLPSLVPPSHSTPRRRLKHKAPLAPRAHSVHVQEASDVHLQPFLHHLILAFLHTCVPLDDDSVSQVSYKQLLSFCLSFQRTSFSHMFGACCSLLQALVDMGAAGKSAPQPSAGQAAASVAPELSACTSPKALALIAAIAKALRAYMSSKRYPLSRVLSHAAAGSAARPGASSANTDGSTMLGVFFRLLQDLDIFLDVVAAVGRTIEEDKVANLLPLAGEPRFLFHDCLRRATIASSAGSGALRHNASSLRHIRTASAFMLLIQEYAWRSEVKAEGSVQSPATVVNIVNSNLQDAQNLLETIGLSANQSAAIVGPALTAGANTASGSQATKHDVPASLAESPEIAAALSHIIESVASYCWRLRQAAVEQVAETKAALEKEEANWTLLGSVASVFGFGSPSAADRSTIDADPVLRVLRMATVPLLHERFCAVHRGAKGVFGVDLSPFSHQQLINAGAIGIPDNLAASTVGTEDNSDVAAVVAALQELRAEQRSWLHAQTLDLQACVSATHADKSNGIAVGDLIQAVDNRSARGLPVAAVQGLFEAAAKDAPLAVLRIESSPLLPLLSKFMQASP